MNNVQKLLFSKRANKVLFFCLNLLFVGPYVVAHQSGTTGLLVVLAILCFGAWRMVWKSPEVRPACGMAAQLFFMDYCLILGANAEALLASFDGEALSENFGYLMSQAFGMPQLLSLLVVGSVLTLLARKKMTRSWMNGVAAGCFELAFMLPAWTDCELLDLGYVQHGRAVLALHCVAVLLWTVLNEVAFAVTDPELRHQSCWMGLSMLACSLVVLCGCYSLVQAMAEDAAAWLLAYPTHTLTWLKTVLLCVALTASGLYASIVADGATSPDACFLWMVAVVLFVLRAVLSYYFPWCWVVVAALLASGQRCFKLDENNGKHSAVAVMLGEGFVAVVAAFLLCRGLGPILLVTVALGLAIYKNRGRFDQMDQVIVFVACEVFAWQICRRFSLGNLLITASITMLAVAAMRLVSRTYPTEEKADWRLLWGVACIFAILCALALRTTVKVGARIDGSKVTITAQAKSDDTIESVSYRWKDAFGRTVKDKGAKKRLTRTDNIRSEVLVVEAVDSDGAQASYRYYFPPWLYPFGNDDAG